LTEFRSLSITAPAMKGNIITRIGLTSGWAVLTILSIFLFGITTLYFSFCSDCNFLLKKQDVVFNPYWRTAFYIHITGGMLAIITGPWQFLRIFRRKFIRLHRLLGKIYLASILLLAGPSGQLMAFYSEGGILSTIGFLIMSILWLWTTWMAYATIRKRDIPAHRDWMTRSFALTLAAVTLRLYVPIASSSWHWDPNFVVESSAWLSWIPNLIVAEILIRLKAIKI
jgi:uncharacterized membrane protein